MRSPLICLLAAMVLAWGCDSGSTEPESEGGTVSVTVTTTGSDLDAGYTITVAGQTGEIGSNGSVELQGIEPGTYQVVLSGLAANCSVTGESSLSVTVTEGGTATVTFAVVCEAIADLVQQALTELEDAMYAAINEVDSIPDLDRFTFQKSRDLFAQALAASPSNDTAAFGLAITTIFVLEDNADLRAAAEEWEAYVEEPESASAVSAAPVAVALPLLWDRASLPIDLSGRQVERLAGRSLVTQMTSAPLTMPAAAPAPSVSELQGLLTDIVAPALEDALEALAEITAADFTFTVTERMQGELPEAADALELDLTEVLALRAGLDVALASIGVATAYVLEPNPFDTETFVSALSPGSDFLTLASGGADALQDALARLKSAAQHALDGLDNLEAETDDQTDDVIRRDPSGTDGITDQELADARSVLEDVQAALDGPTTIVFDEGTPDELTLTVDFSEFFNTPIEDFKALVPAYEVFLASEEGTDEPYLRWTALSLGEWTFPDPTFSGVLPGMTSTQDLIDQLEIDELYWEATVVAGSYRLITIDGVDCLEAAQTGGGCPVDGETYTDGWLDFGGYDGAPEGRLDLSGSTFVSAFGPYTVAANGESTYTVSMDFEEQDATPLALTGTLSDAPGYTSVDSHGRLRGGSKMTFSHLGSVWVFEKEY